VKAGTQVDEARGSLDQRGQDVRCERVDGENMRQAIFGRDAPGLPIADGRIVNDPVEGAEPVHLIGHAPSLGDDREITDDHGLRTRHGGERLLASPLVARVQNYPLSLLDEELSGHSAEPIGRTCNEHPRHDFSPLFIGFYPSVYLRAARGPVNGESATMRW